MKTVKNEYGFPVVRIDKLTPEIENICRVTNKSETINLEVEYIPEKLLIELGSYRKYFKQTFNMYIEEFALHVFTYLVKLIKPMRLKVTVYLTEKTLTPWSVTLDSEGEFMSSINHKLINEVNGNILRDRND